MTIEEPQALSEPVMANLLYGKSGVKLPISLVFSNTPDLGFALLYLFFLYFTNVYQPWQ